MAHNQSAIEQINLGFNEHEDRLLLKVGLADKTEVAVWLTRRVCKSMWTLLHSLNSLNEPSTPQLEFSRLPALDLKQEAIENFTRETTQVKKIENLDFNTDYVIEREKRTQMPMLATICLVINEVNAPPQLQLQCTNGQTVKFALTAPLVQAMTNMMQLATREAGWDLLMTVDASEINLISAHQTVH